MPKSRVSWPFDTVVLVALNTGGFLACTFAASTVPICSAQRFYACLPKRQHYNLQTTEDSHNYLTVNLMQYVLVLENTISDKCTWTGLTSDPERSLHRSIFRVNLPLKVYSAAKFRTAICDGCNTWQCSLDLRSSYLNVNCFCFADKLNAIAPCPTILLLLPRSLETCVFQVLAHYKYPDFYLLILYI